VSIAPQPIEIADPSLEQLRARLAALEARIQRVVERRRDSDPDPDDRFRGLYITDDHVDALLGANGQNGNAAGPGLGAPVTDELADDDPEGRLRFGRLARSFGLDRIDEELLLIAIAPDIDPRFERLYAYLQDDVTQRRPGIGLSLELCGLSTWSAEGRDRFVTPSPLMAGGLLRVEAGDRPMLTRHVRAPDRVVGHLLGSSRTDPSVNRLLVDAPMVHLSAVDELADVLQQGVELVYYRDRVGSAAIDVARSALARTGLAALCLDLGHVSGSDDVAELMAIVVREARLRDCGIVAEPIDSLLGDASRAISVLADAPVPVILAGRSSWEAEWSDRVPWMTEAPVPTLEDRQGLWMAVAEHEEVRDAAARMAAFRLSPQQIQRASRLAEVRAQARGRGPRLADLQAGARAENASGLDRLARRVEPQASWVDLILPGLIRTQLQELGSRARLRDIVLDDWGLGGGATHGRGVTALFSGDPGTGKTMSAEVVAADLGLDLYVVDLSSVVDKYIGETEKNLDRIFAQADRINGVILFDEADALFGQRSEVSDARDRYANVEIAYLLQRMEQFDGLAILTTNLRANIDEAFLRRLDALIDFPMPEEQDRLAIWKLHLPERAPLADDLDLDFMAARFRLSGGHIRNVCLTAAFLAADRGDPMGMADLVRATAREYNKLGRLSVAAEFGPYLQLVQDDREDDSAKPGPSTPPGSSGGG